MDDRFYLREVGRWRASVESFLDEIDRRLAAEDWLGAEAVYRALAANVAGWEDVFATLAEKYRVGLARGGRTS